jgi:hypothetical protein
VRKGEHIVNKYLYIILLPILFYSCIKNKENNEFISENRISKEIGINTTVLSFADFPTDNIWDENECIPILDTQFKMRYQTIITNASKSEPDFDGKYKIVTFGYGSGAQYFFIIDLNSGNVFEGIPSTHGIKYELNSSLIIINDPDIVLEWKGENDIPEWVFSEYILWKNNDYKKLFIKYPFKEDKIE